jgi:hypothetical protein
MSKVTTRIGQRLAEAAPQPLAEVVGALALAGEQRRRIGHPYGNGGQPLAAALSVAMDDA